MSTIKVNNIVPPNVGEGVSIDGLQMPTAGALSNRNKIINGAMVIDQRNAGAAVTTSGSFPVDRFLVSHSSDGAFSAQRDTSNPAGFTNSLKVTCTTADTSLSAGQYLAIIQNVEGFNSADIGFGQAISNSVTLSFWTRSSLTGTFGGAIRNSAANRSYPFTYSISSADTWEYKTVTITVDTSGTWLSDNGIGLRISWGLGAGTDWSGTAGAWNSNNNLTATGATSLLGTLNATFYITGVQLEVGSKATPFEHESYSQTLEKCKRYYRQNNRLFGIWCTTIIMRFTFTLAPEMRTVPTVAVINSNGYHEHWNLTAYSGLNNILATFGDAKGQDFTVASNQNRGRTYGDPAMLSNDTCSFSAEL